MNPIIFTKEKNKVTDKNLLINGLSHLVIGAFILFLLNYFSNSILLSTSTSLFLGYSLLALLALSLMLHFGILSINTFLLKLTGIPDYPVFRQPFKAKSLSEFWGRRWNLAFSEMTAIAVFRPLSKRMGVRWASFISFMLSGLFHEIAISLSVQQSFGLPMLYFVIHGLLMAIEKQLFKKKQPGTLWVLLSLLLPLPFLFHMPFLKGVVWEFVFLLKEVI